MKRPHWGLFTLALHGRSTSSRLDYQNYRHEDARSQLGSRLCADENGPPVLRSTRRGAWGFGQEGR